MTEILNRKTAKRLLLINWSCFQNEIIELGSSTLFTGVNGTGKTTILDAIKENNATLLGLSALMTTTVKSMEETISFIKEHCPDAKIMVGGAVLNRQYADQIGADYYAKDAKEASEIAKIHFKE